MTKKIIILLLGISILVAVFLGIYKSSELQQDMPSKKVQQSYWFVLHRKANSEEMLYGEAGNRENSRIVKNFVVKTGIPGERPTPLPKLVGREYWKIVKKESSADNPETAPYFLTLDIPAPSVPPYGPSPYEECDVNARDVQTEPSEDSSFQGAQCNWILPGAFGLHGVNGDMSRLGEENIGSSGCIRHRDEDIIYLYNLLELNGNEIRYYVEDN